MPAHGCAFMSTKTIKEKHPMRLACICIIAVSVWFANTLDSDGEGYMPFFGKADAKTVSATPLKPLNESHSSYDCRGYQSRYKHRPDYIPEDSFLAAQCASEITGTPVKYILAVQQIECNFGQSNAQDIRNRNKTCRDHGTKNGCSAAGPGQFIPQTWDKRNQNGKCNRKAQELREGNFGELREPARASGVPGYGMDCDGDGIASPWSVHDSACATGYYLAEINKGYNDWHRTFMHYNGGPRSDHSRTIPYANGVLERANNFKREVS